MKNRIGLGTYPLSISSRISRDEASNLVREFIKEGGYYIDTAPLYGAGEAEIILGKALEGLRRDDFFVASKCGYVVESNSVKRGSKYQDVIGECDRSLKRLGLDYLDLYFVHFPDHKTPFSETIEAMIYLQKKGKIRSIGVSNVNLCQLKEYNKKEVIKYVQNRFSLLNQTIDKDYETYLLENKIGIVAYNVIDRGVLTDKVVSDFEVGIWSSDELIKISDLVKNKLVPVAKDLGITTSQLAIAWALQQQYISFVLVGVSSPQYLSINLKANDIKLSSEILQTINQALSKDRL